MAILFLILTVVAGLTIVAFIMAQNAGAGFHALSAKVDRLAAQLQQLQAQLEAGQRSAPNQATASEPSVGAKLDPAPPRPASPPAPTPAPVFPRNLSGQTTRNWERILTENWLVWLGGVTLALGGAFLVKVSIDHGLLTPAVRVVLGIILGFGLSAGGEVLARTERDHGRGAAVPSYVPQALVAAGASTIFASLYAAHALYDFLSPTPAFLFLALTSVLTVLMSLRHGPFVAALGFVGALAVPLLVTTEHPSASTLFIYLALVTAGILTLLRIKRWWWLAWISLVGAMGWVALWLATHAGSSDAATLGGFLVFQAALFLALRRGISVTAAFSGIIDDPTVRAVVRTALCVIAGMVFILAHADGFGVPSVASAFVVVGLILWFAYRDSEFDALIVAAGVLPVALIATWDLAIPARHIDRLLLTQGPPAQVSQFLAVAAAFALVLGGGGFVATARTPRPNRWAVLSAAAPLVLFVASYWRLERFNFDFAWTSAALGLAGLNLLAASVIAKRRAQAPAFEDALAAYAVAVLGATIFAATIALDRAWLTVALALHLPAIGWVEDRLRLVTLRKFAVLVAGAVLVRLVVNSEVLAYPISSTPIFNWLLYGYGVPAISFIVATWQFKRTADDFLVGLLEAGSVVFSVLLVTLELRHAINGRLDLVPHGLGPDSIQAVAWLAMAVGLLRIGTKNGREVFTVGGVLLVALATVQIVLWQGGFANPLFTGSSVGPLALFDALLPAFGLPSLIYLAIAYWQVGPTHLWKASRALSIGLALLWLSLEIRHAFKGSVIEMGPTDEGEWYAYSAAWLAFAAALLAVGLLNRSIWLRRTGLAGIGIVVVKVFVSDTANLSGVWRALSFLGLGAVLLGIGYLYRRMDIALEPIGSSASRAPDGV